MSKSVLAVHRAMEKAKPVYKAIKKVHDWYLEKPQTPIHIASRIQELHERADAARDVYTARQAAELMPMLKAVEKAREEATVLSKKHQKEDEDMAIAFAEVELKLLREEIDAIPENIVPGDSTPSRLWRIGHWFASWLPGFSKYRARLSTG